MVSEAGERCGWEEMKTYAHQVPQRIETCTFGRSIQCGTKCCDKSYQWRDTVRGILGSVNIIRTSDQNAKCS